MENIISTALSICKSLSIDCQKYNGVDLIVRVIETARNKTLTFPGMISFGQIIYDARTENKGNEEEFTFPLMI